MHRRSAPFLFLLVLALLLLGSSASAAPRDAAANQKIEEAINTHYLATEFDKAEGLLKGVLEACEDRCSPQVKARSWMYVGIVKGSGRQDIGGAQEAFQQALALDPNVKLDDALATPAVRQAFAAAAAALGQGVPVSGGTKSGGGGGGTKLGGEVPGNMECTPDVKEVEAQRPIPVACTSDEPASKVMLRYMVFGGDQWQQVAMTKKGEYWQGEIPCADTGVTGKLKFFVQAKDKDGEELDNYGNKKQPGEINVVATTDEEPPAYPGQPAPQKCMGASECPPDMRGTPACPGSVSKGRGNKGWGSPCDNSQECDVGLLCTQGDSGRTCETAPSCESPNDCPSGSVCKNGTCDIPDEASDAGGPAGPYKKNLVSLDVGLDIAFLSGDKICSSTSEFDCFYGSGKAYVTKGRSAGARIPNPKYSGKLSGGAQPGTVRFMAGYERLLTPNLGVQARLGFAIFGGPSSNGQSFFPVHLEARGKYWFGNNRFSKRGLRPYAFVGAGMAQVDAKLTVTVLDCGLKSNPNQTCAQGGRAGTVTQLDAYRKLGLGFIGLGGGAMYAFSVNHGLVLNMNFQYMLGSSGPVIEPSLGYALGL